MYDKQYFIYRLMVNIVAILLLGIKVGFLYISYLISNILNITGFVSNSLVDYILKNTIRKNTEEENEDD